MKFVWDKKELMKRLMSYPVYDYYDKASDDIIAGKVKKADICTLKQYLYAESLARTKSIPMPEVMDREVYRKWIGNLVGEKKTKNSEE